MPRTTRKKAHKPRSVEVLHIRCLPMDLGAWKDSAFADRLTLTAWVTRNLNRAMKAQAK